MEKILNNLGLCFRSGNLIIGEEAVVNAIRDGKVCYVFLANDTGPNTKKKILDKAQFYGVELNTDFDSLSLSQALGKGTVKVIGLKTKGSNFIKILRK